MDGEIHEITQVQVHVTDDSQNSKVIDVIPVQIVDDVSYESLKSEYTSQHNRTKYYKQTYRPAWELMPDFAGWLKGVEGEPTRAFCIYCQKTLHAHRLSLLKHTCTIRHQKAAQLYQMKKKKSTNNSKSIKTDMLPDELNSRDDVGLDEEDDMPEFLEGHLDIGENDEENINDISQEQMEDEADDDDTDDIQAAQNSTDSYSKEDTAFKPITTQVIDAVKGGPISGMAVSLYKLIEGRWTYINEGVTKHNGKFSNFLDGLNFTPGRYKLHYDVDRYFESKKQESLYPFIEITFDYPGVNTSYHIPLILSPNGYTTYKGS